MARRLRVVLGGLAVLAALGGGLATGVGTGYPASQANLLSGTAWLASDQVGQLALLDGSSVEVAAQVRVAPPGTALDVVQAGANAYAVDRAAGSVRRVNGATFVPGPPATPIPGAGGHLRAFAGPDALYALDTGHGILATADPATLADRADPQALAAEIAPQAAVLDGAGRLWLLDTATGDLVWLAGGHRHVRRNATRPGAGLLTVAGGAPVLVDVARRTASVLDVRSGKARHSTELELRPGERIQVSGAPHAPRLYVVTGRGVMSICDLTAATCRAAVPLVAEGSDPGPAIEAGDRVFVPDYHSGQVWIVDPHRHRVVARPRVLSPPARFQLFDRDGVVFFNDPGSERAGVIRLDGGVRTVAKYDPKNPGSGLSDQSGRSGVSQPAAPDPQPAQPQPSTQPAPATGEPAPPDPLPAVRIVVSTAQPTVGEEVRLAVTTDRRPAPSRAHWSFGDGQQADGVLTTHRWTAARTFQVSVRAAFPDGRTAVASLSIAVAASPTGRLTVRVTGKGTVSSQPAGVACPPTCSADFPPGTTVTLSATPAQYFTFSGWGGACSGSNGCTVVLDTNKTVTARYADTAAPEDCFSYDPTRLSIVDLSSAGNGFELRAGTVFLQSLATMRDAQDAQSVARGFTTRCFVGRGDGGGVMPYWKGGAGRPGPVSAPTCFSYNRSTLRVTQESPTKWHLGDGTIVFGGYFVSEAKAVRALRVAQQHNQQCFIGLNNTQNNPQYAMGYWP